MYEDFRWLWLISISEEWTSEEVKQYRLCDKETAHSLLISMAGGRDFGNSLLGWAIYLAFMKLDLVGFEVIVGRKTGRNIALLEGRMKYR